MRPLFLLLLVPIVLLAACGDDDGEVPPGSKGGDSEAVGDAYVGGLRDVQPVIEDPASGGLAGGEVAPADRYRTQAATYREFAAGLELLEPPQETVAAHDAFVIATLKLADDMDAIAAAIDAGDSAAEEMARAALVSDTIPFLMGCADVGLTNCEAWAPID